MGKLHYTAICSLDGYIADGDGDFRWAEPSDEVHGFLNDRERPVGTQLLGRRTYEIMTVWETDPSLAAMGAHMADFAEIWLDSDKIVFSRTLAEPSTVRTRIVDELRVEDVGRLKASTDGDLSIGGPTLAAPVISAGLVDEIELYLVPAVIGGGLAALPPIPRSALTLLDERRFEDGTVHLRYAVGIHA